MALYSTETGLMFDETSETFENYEERLMQFLVANKIESDRRRAVFLSVVGPKTFALLRDLIAPSKVSETEFSDLLKALRDFYTPKKECVGRKIHAPKSSTASWRIFW